MPVLGAPFRLASGIYNRPLRPRVNAWVNFVTFPSRLGVREGTYVGAYHAGSYRTLGIEGGARR